MCLARPNEDSFLKPKVYRFSEVMYITIGNE